MKNEKYRKLNQDEIDLIKKSVSEFLKPINPEVKIDEKPAIIHCTRQDDHTKDEYDVYLYDVFIKSENNEFKDFIEVSVDQNIYELGWNLAYNYFHKFDDNVYSEIGKNLWDNKQEIIMRLKNDKLA